MQKRIERPMLYSTEMVKAILADRKTMTRRMTGLEEINENPDQWRLYALDEGIAIPRGTLTIGAGFESKTKMLWIPCPYGRPGDVLWVRETFFMETFHLGHAYRCIFKTDYDGPVDWNWKPSIHMPKSAARIWLQITDIRVERLQSVSDRDAIEEGIATKSERKKSGWCTFYKDYHNRNDWYWSPKASFMSLWQSINGRDSWIANPWVWVISSKVLSTAGRPAELEEKEVSHG